MKKKLFKIIIGVAVLVALGCVALILVLDRAVKKGIETVAPQIAKVPVTLDSVSLSIFSGNGALRGLSVGNPPGFDAPTAIRVGDAKVAVKIGSILADKIIIHSLVVDSPEIWIEGGLKKNNLTKIMENIEESLKESAQSKESANAGNAAPAEKPATASKKFQIDEFVVTSAKIHVQFKGVANATMKLELPQLQLKALGTGPEGITPAEASKKIMEALLGDTTKLIASASGEWGQSAVDAALNKTEEAGKAVGDAATKAGKKISDLFKK